MSSNQTFPRSLTTFRTEKVTFEILLGRVLAVCVHPFAAWTLLSTSWRLVILTAFAAAGYVIVLGTLSFA